MLQYYYMIALKHWAKHLGDTQMLILWISRSVSSYVFFQLKNALLIYWSADHVVLCIYRAEGSLIYSFPITY